MSNKKLRPFIVKVSVLGYFSLSQVLLFKIDNLTEYLRHLLSMYEIESFGEIDEK